MRSAPYAGGSGSADVTTNRDCTWTASSNAAWLSIISGGTGQGDGTIAFRVAPNAAPAPRHGTLRVNNASLDVTQEPAPCAFIVSQSTAEAPAVGGYARVGVTASSPACAWSAASNAAWIAVDPVSAKGNGTVTITIAANTGGDREGSVVIAGTTVAVHQPAATCSFSVAPPGASVPYGGGAGTVTVTMLSGVACTWQATSDASWVTIATASGTGSGTAAFTVAPNAGASRTATLTIAGKTFSVSQDAAPCTYTLAPASTDVPATGASGSFTVTAHAGCGWTARPGADWIAMTGGASGDGTASVAFSVAPNPAPVHRTGMIAVGDQAFSITQRPLCAYSISPGSQPVPAGGGGGTVAVNTGAECSWSAQSNAPWVTVTSGASGTGAGTVAFAAAANGGTLPRTGTMTIAGQTFTVTQDGVPCFYTISPTSLAIAGLGGPGLVTVTTSDPSCRWDASSNNPDWLTIVGPSSGTGGGAVAFLVAPNGGAPRSGSLTIAAQAFTVTQGSP